MQWPRLLADTLRSGHSPKGFGGEGAVVLGRLVIGARKKGVGELVVGVLGAL